MELGAVLVLIGIILAVVSLFVPNYSHRMLAAAIILVGIGVLVGVGSGISTS